MGIGGNVRHTLLGLVDGSSWIMLVLSLVDHTQLHEQCQLMTKRAHSDLDQGPAALQSAALTTELCTPCHVSALSFLCQFWQASCQASTQPAASQQSTFLLQLCGRSWGLAGPFRACHADSVPCKIYLGSCCSLFEPKWVLVQHAFEPT